MRSIGPVPARITPRSVPNRRHRGSALAARVCAGILALAAAAGALAQVTPIDGRDFSQINLPAQPQEESVLIRASTAARWTDRQTNRLFIEGDVDVSIGPYRFLADRAVIWLEPVSVGEEHGDQIAVYFENVRVPGGEASLAQRADRLLVTAITYGEPVRLRVDRLDEGRPDDRLISDAEARLARYLRTVVAPPIAADPLDVDTIPPSMERMERLSRAVGDVYEPIPWERNPEVAALLANDDRGLEPAERDAPIFAKDAIISLSAPETQAINIEGDRQAIVLTEGVAVQYQPVDDSRPLQIRADRAVVFLNKADSDFGSYTVEDVEGLFLEGDVLVTNGRYTVRGSQVYYDVTGNQAIILDSVLSAYDRRTGTPLYVRADSIRQISERQWTAGEVLLSNVAFAEPHFSIGARNITITQLPDEGGATDAVDGDQLQTYASGGDVTGRRHVFEADAFGFRIGTSELLTLRGVKTEFRSTPLRRFSTETTSGAPLIKTRWDLYALLGAEEPRGNSASLLVDGYFSRGPALGLDFSWDNRDTSGSLLAYGIWDNGEDQLTSGAEIDHDDELRGTVLADQVWRLSRDWTLYLEAAYISDETFVDAFFEEMAESRREFLTGLYARRRGAFNSSFTLEARGTVHDFVPNEYLLQSLGYQTQHLPEVAYRAIGVDLFDQFLSYTGEVRIGRVDNVFSEPLARELGFDRRRRSRAALGLEPNESVANRLRRLHVPESDVLRFDTRHSVELPIKAGALNVVPFASGRFTAYDQDFDQFNSQADESWRAWGAVGVRIATSLTHINNAIKSRLFDIDRIRHIIEPSVTLWHADTTIAQHELPVFDDEVESLADGSAISLGLRNTWQTKRGGSGREHTVNILTMNTNVVWSSSEVDTESPFGFFDDTRPELSRLGRFVRNDTVWQVTDALALTNDLLYDTDEGNMARLTVGALLDHGYGMSSFVEYRDLDPIGARRLRAGARYELTRKYAATLFGTYNLERDEVQNFGTEIERRFPQWTVYVNFSVDNISDDVSVGISFRPVGLGGESRRRVLTKSYDLDAVEHVAPPASRRGSRLDSGPFGR